ncbi:ABC transporter permease [Lachnospiraceae bacterium 29-84]
MRKFFYGKLAFGNLRKNIGLYLPYLITSIGVSAVYYILVAISNDNGMMDLPHGSDMKMILGLGCGVIGVFAVIFLFYTNSFLMKRRKKEFGLFNILGMEKRHIGKLMFWETLMIAVVGVFLGLVAGVILYKLVVLVLLRVTRLEVPFGFTVSFAAMGHTAVLFFGIYALTLCYNLFQVWKSRPIELLHSVNQGEAEPKTRWLMALIGVVALGVGYAIAIVVENPVETLLLFFVAVILVMLGTYCLFTAGSIALLKFLRKRTNYYYKTKHFISVSGMIYRMKQNAVGLANICILSTMVLVMVAGTVSLYVGIGDMLDVRCPKDVSLNGVDLDEQQKTVLNQALEQAAADKGYPVTDVTEYTSVSFSVWKQGEEMAVIYHEDMTAAKGELCLAEIISLADYERITGKQAELGEDEVLVYTDRGEKDAGNLRFNDKSFRVKAYVDDFALDGLDTNVVYDTYFVVVKNSAILQELYEMQKEMFGEEYASPIRYYINANVGESPEHGLECINRLEELIDSYNSTQTEENALHVGIESRAGMREGFLIFCGGFLFLGIFLGFVFLMATVMIIYYKQISEGYEDKARFEIMQKVGMSRREVKASIHSQIINVFFLPLVTACIHLTAAFPMLNRLIRMFNMTNTALFALCTVATVGVFAVIYSMVYGITAKAYYKIVG